MDDNLYDQWTATLSGLREQRSAKIKLALGQGAASFSPPDFRKIAEESLEETAEKWWNLESSSWEISRPPDPYVAAANAKNEFESMLDFEIEALERDLHDVRSGVSWNDDAVDAQWRKLGDFAASLKKSYLLKIDALTTPGGKGAKKEKVEETAPPPPRRGPTSGGRAVTGASVFGMFLVGLLLGAGPSVYFWYDARQETLRHERDLLGVRAEMRAVEDRLNVLRVTFADLAYGRIRNIPRIEALIKPIRAAADSERRQTNEFVLSRREKLLKRMSAGDKLDRALQALEDEKQRRLDAIRDREAARLAPLQRELAALKEMMGDS